MKKIQNGDLKTSKLLVIVESPSKSKTITKILKAAGYTNATVLASAGHIMELRDGGTCFNSGISPENDFAMNLKITQDKAQLVQQLKTEAAAADRVYLMTDGDREGEVISWSLMEFLKIPKYKCFRAITHEITPKAVVYAIENPIELDMNLVNAGKTRMMIDKLIGYGLSPQGRKCIGAKSIGRCQSVGLALVCDRENEISQFVPERYYELFLNFSKQETPFKAKYSGTAEKSIEKFDNLNEITAIVNDCRNAGNEFKIVNIENKIKYESPKAPFCTATFQQEAAQRLGLSVSGAMQCAQKLFEAGKITYHRTDSTIFANEFLATLEGYIDSTFGKGSYKTPTSGKRGAQDGHEALRVVDPNLTPEKFKGPDTNDIQFKVYRLIWQRTVAAAMTPAKISETVYTIQCDKHYFTFTSNELLALGYRLVYNIETETTENTNKITFQQDELLKNTQLEYFEKWTQPKPRYTEASLVKELQKRGIGRPSTYATIVSTILSPTRGYASLVDKKIVPTERGMQLAAFCNRAFSSIINYDYTKNMEETLDKIAGGQMDWLTYMQTFYNDLTSVLKNNPELSAYFKEEEVTCPLCGKPMVLRRNKYKRLFYGCSDYPNCHGIVNVTKGHIL